MATCPNKSHPDWQQLVSSRGENTAYYLWDKYQGVIPMTETIDRDADVIPQIEELNNFQLYEDDKKLCPNGICNYTARKATEKLREVGLNPFPNQWNGDNLAVTVKGPLGDFNITHYVSAVAINDTVYIYDMPQQEFISNDFFGQGLMVSLKSTFRPRLIPLDIDSIKSNYDLSSEHAAKFVRDILTRQENNVAPSFKSYITANIKNGRDYIFNLENQITKENILLDSREEYQLQYNSEQEVLAERERKLLNKELTSVEEDKVINFLRNKLKAKLKPYLPTITSDFVLRNLIKFVTGINYEYDYGEGLDSVLNNFDKFVKSEDFVRTIWQNYRNAKSSVESITKSIDKLISTKQLLDGFFKLAKFIGFDEALKKYSTNQQYFISTLFPSNLKEKYTSEKQMIFMLQKRFSNINVLSKQLNTEMGKSLSDIFTMKMKANARLEKATTILNYLKAVDFDASYISESIDKEARRRYTYFSGKGNTSFQLEEMPSSKASPETLNKVKEVAKKMGVDIQKLTDYAKKTGVSLTSNDVNGVANLALGVIAIAEGREDIALTEEVVHIATAILEQTNPTMVTEMISKIDRFAIYKQTLNAYKDDKDYQLENGKPNIRLIKKEAVDKLIAELIVNQSEGSTEFPELMQEVNRSVIRTWWNAILDTIRGIYKKANIDIFGQVANKILSNNVEGNIEDLNSDNVLYQLSKPQLDIQAKLQNTKNTIRKVESTESVDPMFMDTEEANNWYEIQQPDGTWERIKKRVTDRVKAWYKQRFPGKTFTPEEKAFNEFKRQLGVQGHAYFEEIHSRYFNDDGTRKVTIQPRSVKLSPSDEDIYDKLEAYYSDLINKYSKDGKTPLVFSEVKVYDPKEKEAGTLDLLIIEESGKAHIIDWKFMSIGNDAKDIAWYKQGAYNIQLGRYKDILIQRYGIKEIGMNRAIPILMDLKKENPKDLKSHKMVLKGIAIGTVDTSKIEDIRLMPVSEQTETTGEKALDKLLVKLNSVYKQINKKTATSDEEREFKSERLNIIKRTIRLAQGSQNIAPLVEVIHSMRQEGQMIIDDYNTIYKNASDIGSFSERQLSDFAEEIREYLAVAEVFGEVPDTIGKLVYDPKMENDATTEEEVEELAGRKLVLNNIKDEAEMIRASRRELDEASKEFADKFIGERNLVTGLLNSEAVIKGLAATFRGISELPSASLKVLFKIVENAKSIASQTALKEVDELLEIRKRLSDRGGDLRKIVQQIYQKDDKDKITNKLIYKYSKDFFTTIDENAKSDTPSMQILRDSIDVEAYKAEAIKHMEERIAYVEKKHSEDDETLDRLIAEERHKWDIDNKAFNGWNNYILKRHPKEAWLSKEYKELSKDKDLLELYNFISGVNKKATEAGYLQNKGASTFLPFVRKSMAESIAWDFSLTTIKNWGDSFKGRTDDVGYGSINELTGEMEHSIPKYYTSDFSTKEDGTHDYSDVSEDLFKNMILYINHVEKYKHLSDVEGQLQLVKTIETFKGHLNTSRNGDVIFEDNNPKEFIGNEENAKLFDDFLRALLYEQKYPLSSSDIPLGVGKVMNFMKQAVNNVVGSEVFTINDNPSALSLVKTMDSANRWFQVKTLGFEFISGAVNIFGGNIQVATQAGNYFKAREFLANESKLIGNGFRNDDERKMFMQLVDKFMPLKDDPTYEKINKAGMSVLTQHNFVDWLMIAMRKPEEHLEKSVFLTLLDNTMVEDGRLVSIREYVKSKHPERFTSAAVYKGTSVEMNNEIEELKKTRSISAIKKMEDGKLVIPGFDLDNTKETQRLTNLTRMISRNATGALSNSDLNRMGMNIWTKSMMVFKNWIPKLVDTRFSEFRKISDDFSVVIGENGLTTGEKYDIGRIRLWGYVIGTSIRDKTSNLYNIISLNDKGLLVLDKMYEDFGEKYKLRTGQELNMSKEDFIDLIRTNLQNQVKELAMLLSLFGAMMALGLMVPDDDDDKASKNFYRYSQRVVDKFITELSFFYNPAEFQRILSGSVFPAIGIFTDVEKFISNFMMETTGMDITNSALTPEEVMKKAQPVKYLAKMFPITKSVITYMSLFDSDFAKEYNITVQKQINR